ncbi:MAG: hypothetical protein ACM3PY_04310 [Omnitrophica WOR_2 bacterium]
MDTGTILVVVAVLLFYLRLILLQRQAAKRLKSTPFTGKQKKQDKSLGNTPSSIWILSRNRRDWVFAGIGLVMILIGLLIRAGVIPIPQEPFWWIITVAGLVPFSLGFH